jgi:hypothetical protein
MRHIARQQIEAFLSLQADSAVLDSSCFQSDFLRINKRLEEEVEEQRQRANVLEITLQEIKADASCFFTDLQESQAEVLHFFYS